jgi:hypothetical protein
MSVGGVLEVGGEFVNGSVKPREYVDIGVDLMGTLMLYCRWGLLVVLVLGIHVVVSMEIVEHVLDWELVINGMNVVSERGGLLY